MNRHLICTAFLALVALSAAPVLAAPVTDVVETGGDNEATDTIPAKYTGQTFQVTVAGEPFPGAVVGNNFTVPVFGSTAPAYVDRAHRYLNDPAVGGLQIPFYLVGGDYIMSGNDNRDNASYRLDVTVSNPASVFMLIDNRLQDTSNANPPTFDATHMQWIVDQGWISTNNGLNRMGNILVPDEVPIDEAADGTINNWFSVYRKDFPAGTFALLQPDNAGQNMYGVVIVPLIPEPAAAGLLAVAGLLGLSRRQRIRRV